MFKKKPKEDKNQEQQKDKVQEIEEGFSTINLVYNELTKFI
jgi:hypothetical protein